MNNLLDRDINETRGVVRNGIFHVIREVGRQFGQALLDRSCGLDRVGARRQLDRRCHGGSAIQARVEVVTFLTDFHAGDVAQFDRRTVLVGTQDNTREFFRIIQRTFHRQGGGQFLLAAGRRTAEAASRHLHVLATDGRADVVDG